MIKWMQKIYCKTWRNGIQQNSTQWTNGASSRSKDDWQSIDHTTRLIIWDYTVLQVLTFLFSEFNHQISVSSILNRKLIANIVGDWIKQFRNWPDGIDVTVSFFESVLMKLLRFLFWSQCNCFIFTIGPNVTVSIST